VANGASFRNTELRSLVKELHGEYSDVATHVDVKWLSRGKVLDRFMELLPAVRMFVEEKG